MRPIVFCARQLAALFFVFVLGLQSASAEIAPENNLCTARGYTIGFFNGVWNTEAQALAGLAAIRRIGPVGVFKEEPVQYELFYNRTGRNTGATAMQDIAEVFVQKARELDTEGALERRFELLWELLSDADGSFVDRIKRAAAATAVVFDAVREETTIRSVAALSELASNPPTDADLARHRGRLQTLGLEGQKLLLVAHSQGNLFVNRAYDYVAPIVGAASVKTVHVAPAAAGVRGEYALADIDVVINGLRAFGTLAVPASNLGLPVSSADLSGHTLIGTYLDVSRPGRLRFHSMLVNALTALETPTALASRGFFTVTLQWNGTGDVDLHTFEPNGTHVYYAASTGVSGRLDVDNVTATGPEHYFATCDKTLLQTGAYRIGINNFARATGRLATLQASASGSGELLTRTVGVGPTRGEAGDSSPNEVMVVTVSTDATGKYVVSAR